MVHAKENPTDPDLDDKVPLERHFAPVVSAGDGVFLSETNGPVNAEGAHMNLPEPAAEPAEPKATKPAAKPKK